MAKIEQAEKDEQKALDALEQEIIDGKKSSTIKTSDISSSLEDTSRGVESDRVCIKLDMDLGSTNNIPKGLL